MAEKTMMRVVWFRHYKGSVEGLEPAEISLSHYTPKSHEVLLKVEAVSVNPADWKVQKGLFRPFLPAKFPYIPGTDVAGEVVALGPGVTNFAVGQKVVSWLDIRHGGGFAEYAIASTRFTAHRPPTVSADVGACLPTAGMTALQSVRDVAGVTLDGNYRGSILVTAASGGVGHYAVQIAKLGGAHVTATCGSRNAELVRSLGADDVLDYHSPEGAQLQSPSGRKYDAVLNCSSDFTWSTFHNVLAPHGKVIELNPTPKIFMLSLKQKLTFSKHRVHPFFLAPKAADLELLVDLAAEGRLRTVVDSMYTLTEADKAWQRSVEGHATGKVVVKVVDDSAQERQIAEGISQLHLAEGQGSGLAAAAS